MFRSKITLPSFHCTFKTLVGLVVLVLFENASAMTEEYEISNISEISSFLKNHSSDTTLVVLDWDNTVTLKDGDDTIFREPQTKKNIQAIKEQNYDLLYLTSRHSGTPLEELIPNKTLKLNIEALNQYLEEMDAHFNILKGYQSLKSLDSAIGSVLLSLPIYEKNDDEALVDAVLKLSLEKREEVFETSTDHMILTHNVVFAGAHVKTKSNKGPALAKLLDLNLEGSKSNEPEDGPIFTSNRVFKTVIFVDNDYDHINSMREAFKDRSENLILLFYPQE